MKKKLLIITTGGTLASANGSEGLVPALTSKDIFSGMEGVTKYYEIDYLELFSLDSSNIQPEEWKLLAQTIYEKHLQYEGIVVIHGTDTMAYTASALSFMLQNIPIPVVLTGSQLSILNPIADAVENCRCAINMAGSGVAGVYVAFNRKIIRGTRASKVRTISFDAFESINSPYVGVINSNGLDLAGHLIEKPQGAFSLNNQLSDRIFLLKLIPGTNPDLFEMLFQMGYRGIVMESFGIGGMHFERRDLTKAIGEVIKKGMTVVVGSQCLYEGSNLSIYQTGQRIQKEGAIPCHDMTTEAAVTKLMWVLGQTSDKEAIEAYFHQNLAGEVNLPKKSEQNFI
ncbi:MAG: L-asparaginase [Clostridiales bacterium]|nr:L-asparaginase [Clostridiales bacterium]